MLSLLSQSLSQAALQELEQFCVFAYGQTRFSNTSFKFHTFDPTFATKAATEVEGDDLIVHFNIDEDDTVSKIIEILAHESIHAHQLSSDRLKYVLLKTPAGIEWGFTWEGKVYQYPKTIDEVLSLPWEIEAYRDTELVLAKFDSFYIENKNSPLLCA